MAPSFVLFTLCVVLCQSQSPPVIIRPPEGVRVMERKSVTLHCEVKGDPKPVIDWYKNGIPVTDKQSTRTYLQFPDGRLFISDVYTSRANDAAGDAGLFHCEAYNSEGRVKSKQVTVQIIYLRSIFPVVPKNQTIKVGEKAHMTCKPPVGNPPPSILWYKDNDQSIQGNGTDLIIPVATRAHAGWYFCVAHNGYTKALSPKAYLLVGEEPRIPKMDYRRVGVISKDIILPCQKNGVPWPEVTWSFKGTPIPIKTSKYVFSNHSLLIKDLRTADEGLYTCSLQNMFGKATKSIQLNIEFKANWPHDIHTYVGRTVTLPCTPIYPEDYKLYWEKELTDENKMLPGKSYRNIEIKKDGRLILRNANIENSGSYRCTIKSTQRASFRIVNITVEQYATYPPPVIDIGPINATFSRGQSLMLPCITDSSRRPTITWSFNGGSLLNNMQLQRNGSLLLSNLQPSHTGAYTCKVSNNVGNTNWTGYLSLGTSSDIFLIMPRLPKAPVHFSVVAITPTSVELVWQSDPEMIGFQIEYYNYGNTYFQKVFLRSDSITKSGKEFFYTVDNLRSEKWYHFVIRNLNHYGFSSSSQISYKIQSFSYIYPPSTPFEKKQSILNTGLRLFKPVSLNSSSVRVNWYIEHYQMKIKSFKLSLEDAFFPKEHSIINKETSLNQRSFLFTNLNAFTKYKLKVQACNEFGCSGVVMKYFQTLQAPPSGPPRNVETFINESSVVVRWDPPRLSDLKGVITHYVVIFFDQGRPILNHTVYNATSISLPVFSTVSTITVRVAACNKAPTIGRLSDPIPLYFSSLDKVHPYEWILYALLVILFFLLIIFGFLVFYFRKCGSYLIYNHPNRKKRNKENIYQHCELTSELFLSLNDSQQRSLNSSGVMNMCRVDTCLSHPSSYLPSSYSCNFKSASESPQFITPSSSHYQNTELLSVENQENDSDYTSESSTSPQTKLKDVRKPCPNGSFPNCANRPLPFSPLVLPDSSNRSSYGARDIVNIYEHIDN